MKKMIIKKPWYMCPVLGENDILFEKAKHCYLVNDGSDAHYDVEILEEYNGFYKVKVFADDGDTITLEVIDEMVEFHEKTSS